MYLIRGFFLKIVTFFTHIRHGRIERKYRYFISENYFARLNQLQFIINDYITKPKYKIIEFQGEFQQELCFVMPFAYWHFKNGTLKETISSRDTANLYFFSPMHTELYTKRIWQLNSKNFQFPNMTHTIKLNVSKWMSVPLKKQYRNDFFLYDKPILIIANKYNTEWSNRPQNYLGIEMLNKLISMCKGKYQIIYNRPQPDQIVIDNSDILDLNEFNWLKEKHPEVLQMQDLFQKFCTSVNSFNHLQLMVYANCEKFISVHGGTAALASYFEGTNIILSKCGVEHVFNEFNHTFSALSGAKILHAKSEEDVLTYVQLYY